MNSFKPDIIIEVTATCDRSCSGCYAPNFLSKKDPLTIYQEKPELFISLSMINSAFKEIDEYRDFNVDKYQIISIRGGEPSLHPELSTILKSIRLKATEIYVETHGRWLLELDESSPNFKAELAKTCVNEDITLKISYDKMHGLSSDQLKSILEVANSYGIKYVLAITENTINDFNKSISEIPFVNKDRLIFQRKAIYSEELIRPSIAIINVSGKVKGQLTNLLRSQVEVSV